MRRDTELTAYDRAVAAWLWSQRRAALAGLSAAVIHGSKWIPDGAPAELLRGQHHSPPGIIIRKDTVRRDELCLRAGIDCTTVQRTAYDLGRHLPFHEGLQRVDALLNATRVPVDEVAAIADRYPGARGIRRLRKVLELADRGAESPPETQVRLILIEGGLPRPTTQIVVGRRRVDMGWPEWRVGVEYDGAQHWEDPAIRADDIDRHDFLVGQTWLIVRVSAQHLWRPQLVVARTAAALHTAGCRLPEVLALVAQS